MEIWLSKAVTFNPAIISESDREIRGVATAPIYDRENELITQDAVAKALNDFMELPVLTVDHLEFPVGIVTKAEFDSAGQLIVEAKIKKAKSCDDIWSLVKSGVLNSFSIAGRRTDSTCNGDGNACITKGLHINAITLCGENRCNPAATFVVKEVIDMDNEEKQSNGLEELTGLVKSMGEAITGLTQTVGTMQKTFDEARKVEKAEDKEKEKSEKDADMKKSLDDMSKKVDELTSVIKAMDERLVTVENRKVEKAVVTIDDEGKPLQPTISPMESYAKHLFRGSHL